MTRSSICQGFDPDVIILVVENGDADLAQIKRVADRRSYTDAFGLVGWTGFADCC